MESGRDRTWRHTRIPLALHSMFSNVKNEEKEAIVSGRDSDSGNFSLPSLQKRESRSVRQETGLEAVELC